MKKVEGPVLAFGVLYDICSAFEDVFFSYNCMLSISREFLGVLALIFPTHLPFLFTG